MRMRNRPSARILVIDEENRVLLFRFSFREGALAGTVFWATPGGALELGESYEEAAKRELFEETGISIDFLDNPITDRRFTILLPDGEEVIAQEKIFLVRTKNYLPNTENHTQEELEIISSHKWWKIDELQMASEKIYPEDLVEILVALSERSSAH
jgi:8-oxo-dGTP pyrophosphatase MutT (NUDIX family)